MPYAIIKDYINGEYIIEFKLGYIKLNVRYQEPINWELLILNNIITILVDDYNFTRNNNKFIIECHSMKIKIPFNEIEEELKKLISWQNFGGEYKDITK